ncbi:TetR/AcrR family transcriptional regulator [Sphingomonas liriopis]|nr:TetR/AcrR family transcriptional regulator [Sphingomonas liriopis]
MGNSDNSVNMMRGGYHHGDLRRALITEGLRLLAERDVDLLSLREVARGVGVSATSVYRHFPDKDALMTALAMEGLDLLGAAQRRAGEGAGGGRASFAAIGRAYVRFALANPALFRLIFASPALASEKEKGDYMPEAGALLRDNAIIEATRAGGDPDIHAKSAWALVHGLAMLMLDGQIPPDEALIDRVIC